MENNEFVVELDRGVVVRARRWVTLALAVSAAINLLMAAGVTAGIVLLVVSGGPTSSLLLGLVLGLALMLVASGGHTYVRLRRLRRRWGGHDLPDAAMRISRAGVQLYTDAVPRPVFLPWHTVAGFHLGNAGGRATLVLDLAPGVSADTPGISGLEHPEVQRALRRRRFHPQGLQYALRVLRQPLPAIDQALAYYSGGRVRIHQSGRAPAG
jgi:hypothetical protein